MKVLHLIDSRGVYGAERAVLALAAEQARRGISVSLVSIGEPGLDKPIERQGRMLGLDVLKLGMPSGLRPLNAIRLKRFLEARPCDVVHTHGYKPNVLMALLAGRRPPHVITLHGWTSNRRFSMNALYESVDRLMLQFADCVVVVSEQMRHKYRKASLFQAKVIPSGIPELPNDPKPLDPGVREFCSGGSTFVCIGRLSAEKDQSTAVRALAELRRTDPSIKAQLLLLGDGPRRLDLERQVSESGLEGTVCFAGYIEDAWRAMRYCRALVISSLTEGLPIVLLEAMRSGIPVVTTPVGGIEAAIGRGAWFFPPGDYEALAQQLRRVLTDSAEVDRRRDFAKKRCEEVFSIERMADDYDVAYQGVLARKVSS